MRLVTTIYFPRIPISLVRDALRDNTISDVLLNRLNTLVAVGIWKIGSIDVALSEKQNTHCLLFPLGSDVIQTHFQAIDREYTIKLMPNQWSLCRKDGYEIKVLNEHPPACIYLSLIGPSK